MGASVVDEGLEAASSVKVTEKKQKLRSKLESIELQIGDSINVFPNIQHPS